MLRASEAGGAFTSRDAKPRGLDSCSGTSKSLYKKKQIKEEDIRIYLILCVPFFLNDLHWVLERKRALCDCLFFSSVFGLA